MPNVHEFTKNNFTDWHRPAFKSSGHQRAQLHLRARQLAQGLGKPPIKNDWRNSGGTLQQKETKRKERKERKEKTARKERTEIKEKTARKR